MKGKNYNAPILKGEYFISDLSKGNKVAYAVAKYITNKYLRIENDQIANILKWYSLREYRLEKLFVSCCDSDYQKLETTLALLACNQIDRITVIRNLELKKPVAFIKGEVPEEFKLPLDRLINDDGVYKNLRAYANELSKPLTAEIQDKYKEYLVSLQKC